MNFMNGAYLILLLRQGKAHDWKSLCEHFGLDAAKWRTHTNSLSLHHTLKELRSLGLLAFEMADNQDILGPVEVTPAWTDLQAALGRQRLAELAAISHFDGGVAVKPVFGRPPEDPRREAVDVFVAMPFTPELEPIYANHIRKVVEAGLGRRVRRADDISLPHPVINDIWADIWGCRAVVADCTGKNSNVFYEIGMAHVVGKPVVLITQSPGDIPFNLRHMRFIEYAYTPVGMPVFEEQLEKTLRNLLAEPAAGAA